MVALGYGGAKKDLIYPRDDYVVQIKGKDGDIERSLLRSFGRGILVLDRKSKTTEFWQWDVISSIRRRTSIPSQQSFSCEWFKFNCYSALEKPRV